MTAKVWLDQGSVPGFQNIGPNGLPTGFDSNPNATGTQAYDTEEGDNIHQPQYEPLMASSSPLFGTSFNLWTLLASARANATSTCAGQPVNGHVPGNGSTTNPYGPCNGLAVDGRMVGSTTYYIGWQWDLPASVGNEVQTDSVGGDVIFNVVQHRNNPGHNF
ncbi:MAG: hypothetical protein Q7S72_01690 [Candidatus Taylorbacteria bacterium]|nr:hypothetical protein [Candidatus Taylorbacteria bacterium]